MRQLRPAPPTMKQSIVFLYLASSLVISTENGESVEGDIQDLVEMVPFERVMALGMEYAIRDAQVKHFLHYLTSQHFKHNVANLEASTQFRSAAGFAEKYNVDLYSIANRVNHALDIPLIKRNRTRRSPGEGVISFVQDVMDMMPVDDMKQVYRYKMESNPRFKDFMDHLVTRQAGEFMDSLAKSKPFQDTRRDLINIGIPVDDLVKYLTERFTVFLEPKITTHEEARTD